MGKRIGTLLISLFLSACGQGSVKFSTPAPIGSPLSTTNSPTTNPANNNDVNTKNVTRQQIPEAEQLVSCQSLAIKPVNTLSSINQGTLTFEIGRGTTGSRVSGELASNRNSMLYSSLWNQTLNANQNRISATTPYTEIESDQAHFTLQNLVLNIDSFQWAGQTYQVTIEFVPHNYETILPTEWYSLAIKEGKMARLFLSNNTVNVFTGIWTNGIRPPPALLNIRTDVGGCKVRGELLDPAAPPSI